MNILNMEGGASQSLTPKAGQYVFFLGGNDAEMETIRDRLKKTNHTVIDKNLGWWAKATVYEAEIQEAILKGKVPVLVELSTEWLSESLQWLLAAGSIKVIDHHGEKAQEKASILQVIELIWGVPSRIEAIIAANDSGYISGMQQAGASQKEIATVRALERKMQWITEEMEQEAVWAIDNMERFPDMNDLIVIHMKHSKSATITDRLFGKQAQENILIISEDGEVNYFGDGKICAELKEKFEGWNGGSGLGKAWENAYWGWYPNQKEVEKFIKTLSIKL